MEDILQQGGQITLTALGSLAALFLLTKLSGNKQVSQMNLFDYVMGITIGSIAAEMASELESPLRPLWAMVVYGLTAWGIALLTNRSIRVRRFIKPGLRVCERRTDRSFKARGSRHVVISLVGF